jgi:hypothetical protein
MPYNYYKNLYLVLCVKKIKTLSYVGITEETGGQS